jgi:hypothetical protein
MRKRISGILLALCLLATAFPCAALAAAGEAGETIEAVYLGIRGYGKQDADTVKDPAFDGYLFSVDGKTVNYKVAATEDFTIQSVLQEGYIYSLTVSDGTVTAAVMLDKGAKNVVCGEVSALDAKTVTVAGKALKLGASAKWFEIRQAAGGATVTAITSGDVKSGETVKVVLADDGSAATVYKAFVAKEYTAPVKGVPGVRTLKNLLATAFEPVGTALYIYGGSWDWEDDTSSLQSTTIGLSQSWIDFFQQNNSLEFSYKTPVEAEGDEDDAYTDEQKENSYYPFGAWNEYYYAGIDCSAYIGWLVYNVRNTESSTNPAEDGYVGGSTKTANRFADYGWGTKSRESVTFGGGANDLKVGDIFSMSGHVWMVVGNCADGSVVIIHSTASKNRNDVYGGGGVQLSAMNPNDPTDKNCEAYKLATEYMSKYYPEWYKYHDVMLRNWDSYTAIASGSASKDLAGKFTWDLSGEAMLSDPDGYADMSAAEILADLFAAKASFSDVPDGTWFAEPVAWAVRKGITNGTTATTFSPDQNCTKAQILTFLYRAAGSPEPKSAAPFSDVKADAYYAKAAAWAAENGIVGGTEFAPETPCTREMAVEFMWKCAQSPSAAQASFTDVTSPAVNWAVEAGVTDGVGNNLFAPEKICTRAEIATFLFRGFAK